MIQFWCLHLEKLQSSQLYLNSNSNNLYSIGLLPKWRQQMRMEPGFYTVDTIIHLNNLLFENMFSPAWNKQK